MTINSHAKLTSGASYRSAFLTHGHRIVLDADELCVIMRRVRIGHVVINDVYCAILSTSLLHEHLFIRLDAKFTQALFEECSSDLWCLSLGSWEGLSALRESELALTSLTDLWCDLA